MTQTIVLTDLIVTNLYIDYGQQLVKASYKKVDANGQAYLTGEALFWVTMPNPGVDPSGNPLPIPDNWFKLPDQYLPTLLSLRDDADTALTAKFLV
jgi:hypothetical protein